MEDDTTSCPSVAGESWEGLGCGAGEGRGHSLEPHPGHTQSEKLSTRRSRGVSCAAGRAGLELAGKVWAGVFCVLMAFNSSGSVRSCSQRGGGERRGPWAELQQLQGPGLGSDGGRQRAWLVGGGPGRGCPREEEAGRLEVLLRDQPRSGLERSIGSGQEMVVSDIGCSCFRAGMEERPS